jgi:hypothetical protein
MPNVFLLILVLKIYNTVKIYSIKNIHAVYRINHYFSILVYYKNKKNIYLEIDYTLITNT